MSERPVLIGAEIDKYTIFDYIFSQNKMFPNLNRVLRVQYFSRDQGAQSGISHIKGREASM